MKWSRSDTRNQPGTKCRGPGTKNPQVLKGRWNPADLAAFPPSLQDGFTMATTTRHFVSGLSPRSLRDSRKGSLNGLFNFFTASARRPHPELAKDSVQMPPRPAGERECRAALKSTKGRGNTPPCPSPIGSADSADAGREKRSACANPLASIRNGGEGRGEEARSIIKRRFRKAARQQLGRTLERPWRKCAFYKTAWRR
jgi:hypothetical protein